MKFQSTLNPLGPSHSLSLALILAISLVFLVVSSSLVATPGGPISPPAQTSDDSSRVHAAIEHTATPAETGNAQSDMGSLERGGVDHPAQPHDRPPMVSSGAGVDVLPGATRVAKPSVRTVTPSVTAQIRWVNGGTRERVAGSLPAYPGGEHTALNVRLKAVVLPDGRVKGVGAIPKGGRKFEETALRTVRMWKFESLRKKNPQKNQTCLITFSFRPR